MTAFVIKTLCIMTLSIITFRIMTLILMTFRIMTLILMTFRIMTLILMTFMIHHKDTWHNDNYKIHIGIMTLGISRSI
jgi:hypothetical protein